MSLYPGAQWHGPVPNRYPGGMGKIMGLVVHIMDGTPNGSRGPGPQVNEAGQSLAVSDGIAVADAIFHNPSSQVSAHFGNGFTETWQWVDLEDAAWAEVQGNPSWFSIENTGLAGDTLLPFQFEAIAQLFAWICTNYDVPCQTTTSPEVPGLGYHAMGGVAWGDHPCPCPPIIAQLPAVVARAKQILNPAPPIAQEDDDVKYVTVPDAPAGTPANWLITSDGFRIAAANAAGDPQGAKLYSTVVTEPVPWTSIEFLPVRSA